MKRIISLLLVAVMAVTSLGVSVYAAEANYDDLVAPCYTNIDSVSAGLSEGVLGFVTCTSNFISFDDTKTFVLTCYLQRTDGSSGWVNYKSKSETYSGMGSYTIEKSWFAPSGYAYRTYTKLQVKNSAGTVVETATKASAVYYNW
ncbi:MAG: hypothetical protein IJZ88_01590 [Clostridia bacterium]|nr:hypothetical protein [Clostridia bacterium]